jgi:hypothetical protein
MNLNASISQFITNKYVLNIVFFVSILNIMGYVIYRNYDAVMYFVLVGMLVAYFSKNMTLILGIPLILVNLFSIGKRTVYEGLENKVTAGEEATENQEQETAVDNIEVPSGGKKIIKETSTIQENFEAEDDKKLKGKPTEKFEVGRKKGQYNIDYASTIEDAYDDLNKIIGGDGMKKLTEDSQRLMKQQQDLAKAMESIGPLVEKMAPMLQSAQSMFSAVGGSSGNGAPGGIDLQAMIGGREKE